MPFPSLSSLSPEPLLGRLAYNLRRRDDQLFTNTAPFAHLPAPTIIVSSPDYPSSTSTSPSSPPPPNSTTATATAAAPTSAPIPLFRPEHTQIGTDTFPTLIWSIIGPSPSASAAASATESEASGPGLESEITSWVVIVEDPDAPLPAPVVHGLYYNLAPGRRLLDDGDLKAVGSGGGGGGGDGTKGMEGMEGTKAMEGGLLVGRNRPGSVWAGPRPVRGHGVHRYFFQVVGVKGVEWEVGMGKGKGKGGGGRLTKAEVVEMVRGKVVGWGVWVGGFERQ